VGLKESAVSVNVVRVEHAHTRDQSCAIMRGGRWVVGLDVYAGCAPDGPS
jgi:hypothetical protein